MITQKTNRKTKIDAIKMRLNILKKLCKVSL